MEIKIKLTKHEANYLKSPHSFMDKYGEACDVLYKVQKAIDKISTSHNLCFSKSRGHSKNKKH